MEKTSFLISINKGFLVTLVMTFFVLSIHAQDSSHSPLKYSQKDLESLYKKCTEVREDTINRVLINFLNTYRLKKNLAAFNKFCTDFKKISKNPVVYRRARIIELEFRLRLDSATQKQIGDEFDELYYKFLNEQDYAAALECLFEMGKFPYFPKNNLHAIKVLFFAEKFANKYNLQNNISYQGVLHYIGYNLWEMDKPQQSINYFKKSLETGNVIQFDSMIALNGLGINYQRLDSLKQSVHYFNEASRVAIGAKNNIFNTVVLGSAATALYSLGQLDKAYTYSVDYKNLSFANKLWGNAASALHSMIKIELDKNNTAHAKILLDSLNDVIAKVRSDDYVSQKKYAEAIYLYQSKLNNYKAALIAYKDFVRNDSLFINYNNKSKITELELSAQVRLYEQDMLDREKAIKRRGFFEIAVVGILCSLFLLIAFYLYKRIKKTQKAKLVADEKNLEQAAEIEKLKQDLLLQLENIRKVNQNFQALVSPNNESNIKKDVEDDTTMEQLENAIDGQQDSAKNIQLLKEFDLTHKEQWKEFKKQFIQTYPDFEQTVADKIGAVSSAELRLLMLHKLGLGNKEMAQTLMISPDSVRKGKYRLYKKIGINSAEELDAFL